MFVSGIAVGMESWDFISSTTIRNQKEYTGSGLKVYLLKAHLEWNTYSNQAVSHKHSGNLTSTGS